jgi:hypothetical protein
VVSGNISLAEGSFEPGTVVSSECAVACPRGICPTNPTCSGSANEYSLQLNTKPFKTNTCASAPGGVDGGCLGWQQFVYSSEGGGFIQYWLDLRTAGHELSGAERRALRPGLGVSRWLVSVFLQLDWSRLLRGE